jgi:NitT/TauT family transport system permease protein
VGAVVGEFISAQRGLGVLVQQFSYQLAVDDAFAVILILTIMGLFLFALMEWLERVTVFWLHDARLVGRTRRRQARAQKRSQRGSDQPSGPTATPTETAGLTR